MHALSSFRDDYRVLSALAKNPRRLSMRIAPQPDLVALRLCARFDDFLVPNELVVRPRHAASHLLQTRIELSQPDMRDTARASRIGADRDQGDGLAEDEIMERLARRLKYRKFNRATPSVLGCGTPANCKFFMFELLAKAVLHLAHSPNGKKW